MTDNQDDTSEGFDLSRFEVGIKVYNLIGHFDLTSAELRKRCTFKGNQVISVGRSNHAAIPFKHTFISRKQGEFKFFGNKFMYRNLSENTPANHIGDGKVNRIKKIIELKEGDYIMYHRGNTIVYVLIKVHRIVQ